MPYPLETALLHDLVENDHVALDDEPLLLAIYYASDAAPDEECLFEVARNFGYGEPSEDKHIFQIQFGPAPNFPLRAGQLRLSLTNPAEFRQAVAEGWPEAQDLQAAVGCGQYEMLYLAGDQEAYEIMALLNPRLVAA